MHVNLRDWLVRAVLKLDKLYSIYPPIVADLAEGGQIIPPMADLRPQPSAVATEDVGR